AFVMRLDDHHLRALRRHLVGELLLGEEGPGFDARVVEFEGELCGSVSHRRPCRLYHSLPEALVGATLASTWLAGFLSASFSPSSWLWCNRASAPTGGYSPTNISWRLPGSRIA